MTIDNFITGKLNSLYERVTEDDIVTIIKEVNDEFKIPCDYFYAGGFDSPGYDCEYYNIVWYIDGRLYATDVKCESY